jgi:hypothetical protein
MRKVRKEIAILVTAAKDDLVRVAALNDALAIISGSTAAIQLTRWKIGAIKLAIILEERPLTREDFRIIGIDHRRWIDGRWLQSSPDGLIAASGLPDFRAQHPVNYEQIKADAEKWKPKLLALPAAQRAARRTGKRL